MFEITKAGEVFVDFREQIKKAKILNKQTVFDYADKKGNKEARSHVYKLRKSKTAIDKVRKLEKAESLAYGREIDSIAKSLSLELTEMIEVHEAPLKALEEKERVRIMSHDQQLEDLREFQCNTPFPEGTLYSETLKARLLTLRSFKIDNSYEEFEDEARAIQANAIDFLNKTILYEQKREAEKAELEQFYKDKAEREKVEREQLIVQQAIAKQAEDAIKREAQIKAKQKVELARVEREKIEAITNAENNAKLKIEAERKKVQQAKEQADFNARVIADAERARKANVEHRRTINAGLLKAFEDCGCQSFIAKTIISKIAKNEIKNVQLNY